VTCDKSCYQVNILPDHCDKGNIENTLSTKIKMQLKQIVENMSSDYSVIVQVLSKKNCAHFEESMKLGMDKL